MAKKRKISDWEKICWGLGTATFLVMLYVIWLFAELIGQ